MELFGSQSLIETISMKNKKKTKRKKPLIAKNIL